MIVWKDYARSQIVHEPDLKRFVLKVQDTAVDTKGVEEKRDNSINLDLHYTKDRRLIGYVLYYNPQKDVLPSILERNDFWAFFTYQRQVSQDREKMRMVYHDYNVRLFAYGRNQAKRSYLFVVRGKPNKSKE